MNVGRNLKPIFIAVIVVAAGLAAFSASGRKSEKSEIWICASKIYAENWPFTWRGVEKECITKATPISASEFVHWSPKAENFTEDTGALYLFLWTRLIDKGLATPTELNGKLGGLDRPVQTLADAYSNDYNNGVSKIEQELRVSLAQEGGGYANSLYIIRLLGLVPIEQASHTFNFLKSLVDIENKVIKTSGQYGEEIVEMQELLSFRMNNM